MKHIKLFEDFLNEKSVDRNIAENWLENYIEKDLSKIYGELTWSGNTTEEPNDYSLDSDKESVWTEIKLNDEKFKEVEAEMDDDYQAFAKEFTAAANKAGYSGEILTREEENCVTYKITFENGNDRE